MKTKIINALVLIFLVTILVSCNGPSRREMKAAEEIAKIDLAYYELLDDCYDKAYWELKGVLDNGKITASGYEGDGITPGEVISAMETNAENLSEAFNIWSSETYEDIEDVRTKIGEGTLERQSFDEMLQRAENISVVFSEFTPVKTSGQSKMWTFTELNSGIEFTVISSRDGIQVEWTKKSVAKMEAELRKQMEYVYDMYNDYQEAVELKKAEDDFKWGLLLGGLY